MNEIIFFRIFYLKINGKTKIPNHFSDREFVVISFMNNYHFSTYLSPMPKDKLEPVLGDK